MGESVGSWAWATATGGRLRWPDRAQLLGQFALSIPSLPGEVLGRCGLAGQPPPLDGLVERPVTAIAAEAEAICRAAGGVRPWLYPHSWRTFQFGLLFAQRSRLWRTVDAEVLWVAAMLHDLALGEPDGEIDPLRPCFAVRGAFRADELAQKHGWESARRERLAAAVSLHINVRVPPQQHVEGHLVNLGSGLDVAGIRYRQIDQTRLREVLAAAPFGDFDGVIAAVWRSDADRSKGCRTRFLSASGFGRLIATSPLARRRR